MSTREAEKAYTIAEAAKVKGVSGDTIRRAIKATEPPYLKAKDISPKDSKKPSYRISASCLDAWFDSLEDA